MTPTLTIEEAKNKAAQEFGWGNFDQMAEDVVDGRVSENSLNEMFNRAIELHTESALSSVREKLPDHEEISQREDSRLVTGPQEYIFEMGAQWAINQVKELLK